MKLTQGQVRSATGLSEPTLRVWAKHMPALRACKGKGQNFTFGDVIALMTLDAITRQFGCDISLLAPGSMSLFEMCGHVKLTDATTTSFVLFTGGRDVVISDGTIPSDRPLGSAPFIVVPLAPILERFRTWMSHGQLALPF